MKKKSAFSRFMDTMAAKLLIILIVLVILTAVISSGVLKGEPISSLFTKGFLNSNNIRQILSTIVIQMFMLCGTTLILIGGNIDLSLSGQASIAAMIFGSICNATKLPWGIVFIITLVIAACFGLINTFLVTKLHFPAFIATIGMSSIYSGLCNVMTNGYNVQITRGSFLGITKGAAFGYIPYIFLVACLFIIIFQVILSKTRFGRGAFMTGGNMFAARLAGINLNKTVLILFVVNSVMAACGGMLWASQAGIASPTAIISSGPDMKAISAAMLGGVAFTGGRGNLGGPIVALLLLNVLDNMLTVIGVSKYWAIVAQGLLLAVALIYDYIAAERRHKAMLEASIG